MIRATNYIMILLKKNTIFSVLTIFAGIRLYALSLCGKYNHFLSWLESVGKKRISLESKYGKPEKNITGGNTLEDN